MTNLPTQLMIVSPVRDIPSPPRGVVYCVSPVPDRLSWAGCTQQIDLGTTHAEGSISIPDAETSTSDVFLTRNESELMSRVSFAKPAANQVRVPLGVARRV